jgi:hypothetical protein
LRVLALRFTADRRRLTDGSKLCFPPRVRICRDVRQYLASHKPQLFISCKSILMSQVISGQSKLPWKNSALLSA